MILDGKTPGIHNSLKCPLRVKGSEKVVVSKYLLSDAAAAKTFLHDCPISDVHLPGVRVVVLRNFVLIGISVLPLYKRSKVW